MNSQTHASVHSERALLTQRSLALLQDTCALNGVSLYGQIAIGLSFYLYGAVSTPGYFSVLLAGLYLLFTCQMAFSLKIRAAPGENVLSWAAGRGAGKLLSLMMAMVFLLDAQLAFYTLCAMVKDILPNISSLGSALAIALTAVLALNGKNTRALSRLARMLRWAILAAMLYCAAAALPYGNPGHLFPWLGYGAERVARGGWWMCGCVAGGCAPLILSKEPPAAQGTNGKRYLLLPALTALGLGALTALLSAWLMPVYALARPETLGWRMLLITNMSPSVLSWSLEVISLLFLLLLTLSAGLERAAGSIAWAAGKKAPSPLLITVLSLLVFPAGALNLKGIEEGLRLLSPLRAAIMLGVLLTLWVCALIRRRNEIFRKKAAP